MNVAQTNVAVAARPQRWALAGVAVGVIEVVIAMTILWAVNQPSLTSTPASVRAAVVFDAVEFRRGEHEAITLPGPFDPVRFRSEERERLANRQAPTLDDVDFRRGERELR